jgi:hypothetical protein
MKEKVQIFWSFSQFQGSISNLGLSAGADAARATNDPDWSTCFHYWQFYYFFRPLAPFSFPIFAFHPQPLTFFPK